MACTEEEFLEILGSEVSIDMDKLVAVSRHGIPERVRSEVWKYLVGVSKNDKSEEERVKKQQEIDYKEIDKNDAEITKKIRNHLKRYQIHSKESTKLKIDFQGVDIRNKIENIIISYINYNNDIEYNFGMLAILGPFMCTLQSESDIFHCYCAMMKKIEENLAQDSLTSRLSRFMMYFRSVIPELFSHFEEEEINSNDWAMSWIRYLLSVELPLDCVLRLWDSYLSAQLGLDLHVYVCLAILINFSEELLELEHSEILAFLQHLPGIDMDQIIAQAYNIRDDIRSNNEL
ncbi:ankyrin repeat-containing protein [Cavenderia fasciculata]|uniref:Ankyrin repeat-containing protein n=1 Tax=Cavenderia fasciculata TaxID=261658 RepID=F4PYD8_CACFS|nr:ankyrin repeat-containing protein [Cavenderia fasciculata]EGG19405.1 ankyrin repeat-containing protein [Cavenderia fasciculata]|eukprot:XP_004357676.1 ankyrin repeat-containing protein [Cavenderia fasciculata]